jgi:antitoxin VapB
MSLSIKNPGTEKLARELAEATGESITEAVTKALEESLLRLRGRRHAQNLVEGVEDILRRVDSLPTLDERAADEIIGYDESGLPR